MKINIYISEHFKEPKVAGQILEKSALRSIYPENGLHPRDQVKWVADFVKNCRAFCGSGVRSIFTNSPYILTTFNNHIEAGMAEERIKGDLEMLKKLYAIIPQKEIIHPGEIEALSISKSGTIKSIMDTDTGLIFAEKIDDVSNDLAIQFGQLMDIK